VGPELMADLFGTPSLAGMHLVLQDINPDPLPKMEALAHKLIDAVEAKATVAVTTDQKAALEGADFVIVCISTGGFRSMAVDLDVPAAHGIIQTVGDSVGPGGINRALRNIPVLVGIGRTMEEVCPDAWLFNITNPMTTLTRAVCRETGIKTVGLCHEVGNFTMDLAIALRKPWEAVQPSVTGVNHFPVLTALDIDGADGFDIIRDLVEEVGGLASLTPHPGREEAEKFSKLDFAQRHALKLNLLERWGSFPAAGDRHIAEFLSFALTPESDWGAAYNIELSPIARREKNAAEDRANVDAWLAGTKDLQTWQSGELPSPMIEAILTGEPFEAPVNIPNTGQAPISPTTSWWSRSASSTAKGYAAATSPGCRAPTRRSCAGTPPPRRSRSKPPCAATGRWPRRRSHSTPWPGGGIWRRSTPWWPSSWPVRRSGSRSSHSVTPTTTSRRNRMRIGFIGLGAMGLPMTGHLLAAGHDVTVASRSRGPIEAAVALGAHDGATPRQVAEAAELIILCVPNSPQVVEVVDGMLAALGPGKTVVDCSTIDPEVERAQHVRVGATGARYLDARCPEVPPGRVTGS
jgi:alpha-galactosidase